MVDLFSLARESTPGIVLFETIDNLKGIQGARARHRSIAAIVWERCSSQGILDDLIQRVLSGLNLNFGADKKAFDHFVRSDRLIDSISSLEGRIRFFDHACEKDPTSPYVRQHYARMLSRAGAYEQALAQIDEAIKLGSTIRVLHHTKGVVLAQMAREVPSESIARRRLAQSEAEFKQTIHMYRRDGYGYQGLASLYIDWALKVSDLAESADYLSRAEETIREGLKIVYSPDCLWVESARLQEVIGNQPEKITALENAVKASPSSVIARYLLGRAYRLDGRFDDAIKTLEPTIKSNQNEFRSFTEYALAKLSAGSSFRELIAILLISSLYGLSDARFVAVLGGLYFLDGQYSEAKRIFEEGKKQSFDWSQLKRIWFYAHENNDPSAKKTFFGVVRAVKAGFAWFDSLALPTIFCPGSNFNGINMTIGLKISFNIGFTPKGEIAVNPRTR